MASNFVLNSILSLGAFLKQPGSFLLKNRYPRPQMALGVQEDRHDRNQVQVSATLKVSEKRSSIAVIYDRKRRNE